jgi:hypothetical protein
MGIRSVSADRGITPTIEHASTRIVHGLPWEKGGVEIVPFWPNSKAANSLSRKGLQKSWASSKPILLVRLRKSF